MFDAIVPGGCALIQGASRGIGLEFARQCLAEPRIGHVVATCRSPRDATGLADLAAGHPGRLTVLPLDATDEASIIAAAAAAARIAPRLHLVVNCAGVLHDATRGMKAAQRLGDVRPEALASAWALLAWKQRRAAQ